MKFLNILLLSILALTTTNAGVVKRNDNNIDINDLFDNNNTENSSIILNDLSNAFNSFSNNIVSWFYSIANYYQATANALTYMESQGNVTVTEDSTAYRFDGPGTDKALIFYQGAKVDERAYAEIMYNLAEMGIDCFLVKMPLRIAILGINKASTIINHYRNDYENWYIAGHSLGGAVAAMYAADHKNDIDGLALLAAYSTKQLPEDMKVISLVASNDEVLNWTSYNNNLSKLPSNTTEITIEGGNHAQFGDYGAQSGDGVATISMEEQHEIVIGAILNEFN
ncbi:alpha/beta-hydrolase [Neocallimastix californiae]|jgi:hypothetical protein|uniref:Alpha/beta-hydrolase n=1 Tax=Neocallimastix californiae TaxID=1754190 RepID=A0A1Y2DGD6_9FUNG|nr:alpha/beta-hydrolase [Neocallimastix californiae]|eukprot:ORY58277.1 alpha/beta-hydrolase [Neocallimastix californiae]